MLKVDDRPGGARVPGGPLRRGSAAVQYSLRQWRSNRRGRRAGDQRGLRGKDGTRRWQAGDLMLVDNVRTAHARERFEGPREVLVAMADAMHLADCSLTIEVTAS